MSQLFTLPWKPLYVHHGEDGGGDDQKEPQQSLFTLYAFAFTIAFIVFVHAFEGILDGRQKSSYKKTKFPPQLETTVSEIDEERAREAEKNKKEKDAAPADSEKEAEKEKDGETKNGDGNDKKKKEIDEMKPLLPQLQSKFSKAQSYGLDKINFGMIASTYDTIESVSFLEASDVLIPLMC